jgi:cholestenol delta-isomerase
MAVSADSTMALPFQALMNDTLGYDSVKHPYYPPDANIAGYVANESTVLSLLGSFVAVWIDLPGRETGKSKVAYH